MNVLLIGSRGQLGREVERKCAGRQMEVTPVDLPELDLADVLRLEGLFREKKPGVVVNAAAYTAVDLAETQREKCYAANRDGPLNLARLCAQSDIPLIHVSTDYVFDGTRRRPYRETDPVRPLGVYGRSKAEGEKAVSRSHRKHVIIRTAWLYGVFGKNFVKTMLGLAMQRDVIKVVDDQFGCPTCAADLADALLDVCSGVTAGEVPKKWGVYHFCGSGVTSWYGFARAVFEIAGECGFEKSPTLVPVATSQYPTAAERPGYSALDCSAIRKAFGIEQKPWLESLRKTVREIIFRQDF